MTAVQTPTTFDHGPAPPDFPHPRQIGVRWEERIQFHLKVEARMGQFGDHPEEDEKGELKAQSLMRPYPRTKKSNDKGP
jgi:hypothetical protein